MFYFLIGSTFCLFFTSFFSISALAYPIFAQQLYQIPREDRGRIVCANCHLASKPVFLHAPQSILPGQVFDISTQIDVSPDAYQFTQAGTQAKLNVGGVVVLPSGFDFVKKGAQSFGPESKNSFVFGPVPSNKRVRNWSVKAPNKPGSYALYFGGNQGRGQIYPTGEKSNNSAVLSPFSGSVENVASDAIIIGGQSVPIPTYLTPLVKPGDFVNVNQAITNNPNVGGFGQSEAIIVVQNSFRLIGLQFFLLSTFLAQTALVLKKKQIEI